MALLVVDGFDAYSADSWAANSRYTYTDMFLNTNYSYGQHSTQSVTAYDGTLNSGAKLNIIPGQNDVTLFIGFAYYMGAYPSITRDIPNIFGSTGLQLNLRVGTSGSLSVYRSNTHLATASAQLNTGVWNYIEWKLKISNSISADDCIVKVNGEEVINLPAGTDCQTTVIADITTVQWEFYGVAAEASNHFIDNLYICDETGTTNNDFLGPIDIGLLKPSANGNSSQWDGSDGNQVDNYALVQSADEDTSYVDTGGTGNIDLYGYDNLPGTPGDIFALQHVMRIRNTGTDVRQVKPVLRHSSTNYEQTARSPGIDYTNKYEIEETNPGTAAAWTESDVNALEAGYKLES